MDFKLTKKEELARERVCLALDVPTYDDALEYVEKLRDFAKYFKVGKELFTAEGPGLLVDIQSMDREVFLDLKYHDTPNTVKGAARAATALSVSMFNVHASGGLEMMKAAVEGANEAVEKYRDLEMPKILAVTVLTSIDQRIMNEELRVPGRVEDQVLHYAKLADKAGLDGIVCSAADLYAVKNHLRKDFMYVTPGVKGPNSKAGSDQKRVFTAGNAIQDGSSILVIGRAVTDPLGTGKATFDEMRKSAYDILQDMAPFV